MQFLNLRSRWKWWLLITLNILWLFWMTLRPDGNIHRYEINLVPMAEHGPAIACLINPHCFFRRSAGRFLMIDVIGNIVVFIPLGFGLAGALTQRSFTRTLWLAVLGGFLLSLTIELLQLAVPTRTTDVDDLIFNSLGALLGAIGFVIIRKLSLGIINSHQPTSEPTKT